MCNWNLHLTVSVYFLLLTVVRLSQGSNDQPHTIEGADKIADKGESVLKLWGPDKRLRDFLGKRDYIARGEGIYADEDDATQKAKRVRDFLGKRSDENIWGSPVDKRLRDFLGKRFDDGSHASVKRLRDFLGKRSEFEGEDSLQGEMPYYDHELSPSKRLRDFLGKRNSDVHPYLQKRLRDFLG